MTFRATLLLSIGFIVINNPQLVIAAGSDVEGLRGFANHPSATAGITAGCFLLAILGAFRLYRQTAVPIQTFKGRREREELQLAPEERVTTSDEQNREGEGEIHIAVEGELDDPNHHRDAEPDFRASDTGELKNSYHEIPVPYDYTEHPTTSKAEVRSSESDEQRSNVREPVSGATRSAAGAESGSTASHRRKKNGTLTLKPKSRDKKKYCSTPLNEDGKRGGTFPEEDNHK
eukprot:gb/GECG01002793.1/.p1 GENE.gb/GECG01002793.1/~~gb/GECG01002793.1/.p1  ORF type:complete len:232 (+),score=32.44 gb/GECG01002793.1/:1-696(+)